MTNTGIKKVKNDWVQIYHSILRHSLRNEKSFPKEQYCPDLLGILSYQKGIIKVKNYRKQFREYSCRNYLVSKIPTRLENNQNITAGFVIDQQSLKRNNLPENFSLLSLNLSET